MTKVTDMAGQHYGRLTVIEREGSTKQGKALWRCLCDCGNEIIVRGAHIRSGSVKSCGCLLDADMTGQQFGRLFVVERTGTRKNGEVAWKCKCTCGAETIVRRSSLIRGRTQSCGCLKKDATLQRNTKHGHSGERLFMVWYSMNNRCYNPQSINFNRYGARNIDICDEWRDNYEAFRDWALANGYDENAPRGQCTIDRIDNDKGYSPDNCRWVDAKTQRHNQSRNRKKEETV